MKEDTRLLTIYGARLSKSGKYINLSLVEGQGEEKHFFNACVKIDESAKTNGKVVKGKAIISVHMLTVATQAKAKANDEDAMPF